MTLPYQKQSAVEQPQVWAVRATESGAGVDVAEAYGVAAWHEREGRNVSDVPHSSLSLRHQPCCIAYGALVATAGVAVRAVDVENVPGVEIEPERDLECSDDGDAGGRQVHMPVVGSIDRIDAVGARAAHPSNLWRKC